MALEPQIKEIEINSNKKLDEVNLKIGVNLKTNNEKIEKVLFTKSQVSIEKISTNKMSCVVEGTINSFALTKLESGEIVEIKTSSNFSQGYNNNLIEDNSKIIVDSKVLGAENLSVNEISLSFLQEISLIFYVEQKQIVRYVEEIDKTNQKIGTINYSTISNIISENFEVNSEIDLPSSISKVLVVESETSYKDVICSKDLLTIHGELFTNLIYLTSDEIPKLKNEHYVTEFNQEVLISGIDENCFATVTLNTTKNEFNVDGELSSSKGVLELKNFVNANIVIRKSEQIKTVVDAFCPKKELIFEHNSFSNQQVVLNKTFSEKIDGSYVLNGEEQIDKVVFSSKGDIKVLSAQIKQQDVLLKGVASVFVVYVLDNENHTMESVNIEIPFETKVLCDDLCDSDELFVDVKMKEVEARNKRAKEIDVLVDLNIKLISLRNCDEAVLSNVKVGEDRKENLCNMGIYFVDEANDCWDISKKLLINPEVLMQQNPELEFPITKKTQVVVYRQKVLEN